MDERLPDGPEPVTERQREVARLVAAGKTNRQIAETLGISLDGAKYHVSELLGRLALERREEIGDWYRAQRDTSMARGWRRLRALLGAPLAWGAGVVATLAAAGIMILALNGAGADAPGQPPPPATETPVQEDVPLLVSNFDGPFDYCAAAGTVDEPAVRLRDTPPAYLPEFRARVAEAMGAEDAEAFVEFAPTIRWRCMDGQVLACNPGNNLPCWPIPEGDQPTPEMEQYCREHPDEGIPNHVPEIRSGTETIYLWQCEDSNAIIAEQIYELDARGFSVEHWYEIDAGVTAQTSMGGIEIRTGPGAAFPVIGTLPADAQITILGANHESNDGPWLATKFGWLRYDSDVIDLAALLETLPSVEAGDHRVWAGPHPRNVRTGMDAVDTTIDAVLSGDEDALAALVETRIEPCSTSSANPGVPGCPEDSPDGTLIETFGMSACSGERAFVDDLANFVAGFFDSGRHGYGPADVQQSAPLHLYAVTAIDQDSSNPNAYEVYFVFRGEPIARVLSIGGGELVTDIGYGCGDPAPLVLPDGPFVLRPYAPAPLIAP